MATSSSATLRGATGLARTILDARRGRRRAPRARRDRAAMGRLDPPARQRSLMALRRLGSCERAASLAAEPSPCGAADGAPHPREGWGRAGPLAWWWPGL